ncbi:MAG: sce7725 family protein, partial [Candidatus Delongbacteria bacterium]|nr:sce7725 family protein [Candidatus Delongbacteria bacterium]MCG2760351.1 sce7725 family protein [Candidatus Delongbacteria bacterium]
IIENKSNIKNNVFIYGFSGKLYQRNFSGTKRVLLRDGFKNQKNANYPENEHYSDLHVTYPDENMDGFGDFLIVGDEYSETGGPAWAVAIHLTYINQDKDMYIYHFVSETKDSPVDPAGKFFEALEKMMGKANLIDSMIFISEAFTEFEKLYKTQHYPGLGTVKKLSMQHHLELMASFFRGK